MLLDRTRLPGKESPATVGAGTKVGGGAVIAGVKVGEGAFVAAGEVVEDDVPDEAVWMGGRGAAEFDGKTWDCWPQRGGSGDPSRQGGDSVLERRDPGLDGRTVP